MRNMDNQPHLKRISDFIFETSAVIGTGYSSTVYKGQTISTGAPCAIKSIQNSTITNDIQNRLLMNQVRALKRMDHPHVIHAYEVLQTQKNFYLITPLYEQTLEDRIAKTGPMREDLAMKVLRQINEGLCYLEQQGILHRDIKPANLFQQSEESFVLADFGFCAFAKGEVVESHCNVGSPFYMSPESFLKSTYSSKSDIWALGITMLEVLNGKKPFVGWKYENMIARIEDPTYFDSIQVSRPFREILEKMLTIEANQRISPVELRSQLKLKSQIILGLQSKKEIDESKVRISHQNQRVPEERVVNFNGRTHRKIFSNKTLNSSPNKVSRIKSIDAGKKQKVISIKKIELQNKAHPYEQTPLFKISRTLLKTFESDDKIQTSCLKLMKILEKLIYMEEHQGGKLFKDQYFLHVLKSVQWAKLDICQCLMEMRQNQNIGKNQNIQSRVALMRNFLGLLPKINQNNANPGLSPRSFKSTSFKEAIKSPSIDYYR